MSLHPHVDRAMRTHTSDRSDQTERNYIEYNQSDRTILQHSDMIVPLPKFILLPKDKFICTSIHVETFLFKCSQTKCVY